MTKEDAMFWAMMLGWFGLILSNWSLNMRVKKLEEETSSSDN